MVFLYYLAIFIFITIGSFVQYNYDNNILDEYQLCKCFTLWKSLDERWAFLIKSCTDISHNLSWLNLSTSCAAVGWVIGWFFNFNYLRVPLDDLYFNQIIHNNAHYDCIQGKKALIQSTINGISAQRCPTEIKLIIQDMKENNSPSLIIGYPTTKDKNDQNNDVYQ